MDATKLLAWLRREWPKMTSPWKLAVGALIVFALGGQFGPAWQKMLGFEHKIATEPVTSAAPITPSTVDSAELDFEVYDDNRFYSPKPTLLDHIDRMFLLRMGPKTPTVTDAGISREFAADALIVTFEPAVRSGTLTVEGSPGVHLPIHEVKEFSGHLAVIWFPEHLPAGLVKVKALSDSEQGVH